MSMASPSFVGLLGLPTDEALPDALGLTYPQLQQSWSEYLSALPELSTRTGSD